MLLSSGILLYYVKPFNHCNLSNMKSLVGILISFTQERIIKKHTQTCEEGGAHLRISFWHLLMNFEKPKKSEF